MKRYWYSITDLAATRSAGLSVVAALSAVVLGGVFSRGWARADGVWLSLSGVLWLLATSTRIYGLLELRPAPRARERLQLELGLLAIILATAASELVGRHTHAAFGLVCAALAVTAHFSTTALAAVCAAVAALLELGLSIFVHDSAWSAPGLLTRLLLLAFFGGSARLFAELERHLARARKERSELYENERSRNEARALRLSETTQRTRPSANLESAKRFDVHEVGRGIDLILDLTRRALDAQTCLIAVVDRDGQHLHVLRYASLHETITLDPLRIAEGALGAVIQSQNATYMRGLREQSRSLCYYVGENPARAFLGVPFSDVQTPLRGVIAADRAEDHPFTADDEKLLRDVSKQILHRLEGERVFSLLRAAHAEQEVLYRASQALSAALNEDTIVSAALEAARELVPYDFAAVTRHNAGDGHQRVLRTAGTVGESLRGAVITHPNSLILLASAAHHYLPYREDFDASKHILFDGRRELDSMRSAVVVPMISRERTIGTLVLAAARPGAIPAGVRATLQVLANQVGASLSNLSFVRRLEELATTDGLTGCLNKRAFESAFDTRLRAAARFGTPLSLIVTDVDRFKSVNDTYGHATGDEVLKLFGKLLDRLKRDTDVVARYGGEEFCVLCEQTDVSGAMLLAERIRRELAAIAIPTHKGSLQVTCSLGVASFPDHASNPKDLFEHADKALYAAKQSGRNRVLVAIPPKRGHAAPTSKNGAAA